MNKKTILWMTTLLILIAPAMASSHFFQLIANDTYTDTNGVLLTAHTIDFGGYTYNTPGCSGSCDIQSNQGRMQDTGGGDTTVHLDTPNAETWNHLYTYQFKAGAANSYHGISNVDSGEAAGFQQPVGFGRGGGVTDYNLVTCNGTVIDSNVDATVWNNFTIEINWSESKAYMYINDIHYNNCSIATGDIKSWFYDSGGADTGDANVDNFTMFNSSNSLITEANFTITATNFFFNETINVFNATINGTIYNTTTGGITTPIDNSDGLVFNVTLTAPSHDDRTYFNYNTSVNLDAVLNFSYYRLNITAIDFQGNDISNFTVNATNTTTFKGSTTGTQVVLNVSKVNASYLLWLDATNFALVNGTKLVNDWQNNFQFTNVFTSNSINFSFFNEITNAPVGNVSLELISDVFANNYSTGTNTSIYLDLLSPAEYTIRYNSSNGFQRRTYFFNLVQRTTNNLSLFLLPEGVGTTITATVFDEKNKRVEAAFIKVLKYDLASNSYVIKEILQTNNQGQAVFNAVLNDEFYRFIIEKPLGTVREITTPAVLISNTITFNINLQAPFGQDFITTLGVTHTLGYNPSTQNFRFTYSDSSSSVTQGCMRVYNIKDFKETFLNETCVTADTGTILIGIDNSSANHFKATTHVTISGSEQFLDSLTVSFPEANITGSYGLFLMLFLMVLFATSGIWNKTAMLVLTPLPLFLGSVFPAIASPVSFGVALMINIIAWTVAVIISRK